MKYIKFFLANYKHGFLALGYMLIYLAWFFHLEQTITRNYTVIHMPLDDLIPFCEIFVIPYYLWFAYIAAVIVYLLFTDKPQYYKACTFLFTGMTIFLIVSTLWPNGQHLRPFTMPRDNIFTQMVANLYRTDTPTNIWPSIHVFNSLGAHIAIMKCSRLAHRKWLRAGSFILCTSIVLSTVFLKQHSVFDMITAFIMAFVLYALVYRWDILLVLRQRLTVLKERKKSQPQIG